jgi:hypothetical protein
MLTETAGRGQYSFPGLLKVISGCKFASSSISANTITYSIKRVSLYVISVIQSCLTISVHASSMLDRGFEPRSGQTKDYKIGICCFSAKHAV